MSIPRKRILLLGADEITASLLRVVLEGRMHCRVEAAAANDCPWEWPHGFNAYLFIGFALAEGQRLEALIWHQHPESGYVHLQRRGGMDKGGEWIADVLDRVRLATFRKQKRGPKKPQPTMQGEEVTA